MSMEARVAVLETIAAQISATLAEMRREAQEMRADLHDFRSEMRADLHNFRSEMRADMGHLRCELRTEVRDLRRIHDRDFRITFGAVVTTTLGLAALIAHVAHWI